MCRAAVVVRGGGGEGVQRPASAVRGSGRAGARVPAQVQQHRGVGAAKPAGGSGGEGPGAFGGPTPAEGTRLTAGSPCGQPETTAGPPRRSQSQRAVGCRRGDG